MRQQRLHPAEEGLRVVVEAHLLQYASPVVVDALAGQPSVLVEGEEPAKGETRPVDPWVEVRARDRGGYR
jgi:hypothetical protein